MSEFSRKLLEKYSNIEKPVTKSWIPKKIFPDPQRRRLEERLLESANKAEMLRAIEENVFYAVGQFIFASTDEVHQDRKIKNFGTSWGKFLEKYGEDLIFAFGQKTNKIDFLNHEGFIDKNAAKEIVKAWKKSINSSDL